MVRTISQPSEAEIDAPSYGEAVASGDIVDKSGWHKPTGRGVRDRRPACGCEPQDGNKGAYRDVTVKMPDGRTVHFYHQSPVAVEAAGRVRLSSCGWQTATTKERINRHAPRGYYVHQRDFEWYLKTPEGDEIDFADGIVIEK